MERMKERLRRDKLVVKASPLVHCNNLSWIQVPGTLRASCQPAKRMARTKERWFGPTRDEAPAFTTGWALFPTGLEPFSRKCDLHLRGDLSQGKRCLLLCLNTVRMCYEDFQKSGLACGGLRSACVGLALVMRNDRFQSNRVPST